MSIHTAPLHSSTQLLFTAPHSSSSQLYSSSSQLLISIPEGYWSFRKTFIESSDSITHTLPPPYVYTRTLVIRRDIPSSQDSVKAETLTARRWADEWWQQDFQLVFSSYVSTQKRTFPKIPLSLCRVLEKEWYPWAWELPFSALYGNLNISRKPLLIIHSG